MTATPSIIPDLEELAGLLAQLQLADNDSDLHDLVQRTDEKVAEIEAADPNLGNLAKAALAGAEYRRRQGHAGKVSGKNRAAHNLTRDIAIAKQCILHRADPAFESMSDKQLWTHVGSKQKPPLRSTAAGDAAKRGLAHSTNRALARKSGEHRSPNSRRTIFAL